MGNTARKGGYRPGSGRPEGTGKYKEKTQPIRIPNSLIPQVKALLAKKAVSSDLHQYRNAYKTRENFSSPVIPLYSKRIAAGLPTYADDHVDYYLNFNDYLIQHPDATFCVKAEGNSMMGAGINEGDILIVDQIQELTEGSIIVASLNTELVIKQLSLKKKAIRLLSANPTYPSIRITKKMDFKVLGVVLYVIRSLL